MSTRTITGNLAADPEVVPAGSIQITKLRVIENTGSTDRASGRPTTPRQPTSSKPGSSWARTRPHPCTRETP